VPRSSRRARNVLVGVTLGASVLLGTAVPVGIAAAAGVGSVRAIVTDTQGNPLPGACLYAASAKSSFESGPSDAQGSITESNVLDGKYQGSFYDCSESGVSLGGVPVSFRVKNGKTTDLGTFALQPIGMAFGLLVDGHTTIYAPSVSVTAWDPTSQVMVAPPVCTDPSGFFSLGNLPTTGVKLEFAAGQCPNDGAYVPQWNGGSSYATATVLTIHTGLYTFVPTALLPVTESSKNGKVTITAVTFTGEPTSPQVTVTGHGFGKQAPTGSPPSCTEPPSDVGLNYAKSALFFNDSGYTPWQAGTGGDCIGLVVTTYTNTEIVFSLGAWYGWSQGGAAQGITLLDGDPFMMVVKGAHFTGVAAETGSPHQDLISSAISAHDIFGADGSSFPDLATLITQLQSAQPGFYFTSANVSITGPPHGVSVLISPDHQIVLLAAMSSDNRCWYIEDNEEESPTNGGIHFATTEQGISYAGTLAGVVVPTSTGCAPNDPYSSTGPGGSNTFSGWRPNFPP